MNEKTLKYFFYFFWTSFLLLIIYFAYKIYNSTIGKAARAANSAMSTAQKIYDRGNEMMTEILKPIDENLTEEERKEYVETFANESVKNLLDPREWLTNLSFWWS